MSIFNKDSLKDTLCKLSTSAMDVAENVVKATKEGASTVAKKSNDLIEISKLNLNITTEKTKIEDLYSHIGKSIYLKYNSNLYIDPELVEVCKEIRQKQFSIAVMEDRICDLKNLCKCSNCGVSLKTDDKYCPKCGHQQFMDNDCSKEDPNCCGEIAEKCSCTEDSTEEETKECTNKEKKAEDKTED